MKDKMSFMLKVVRKVFQVTDRLNEEIQLLHKKEACVLESDAKLHPSSRIENNQARRGAIVIAAHSEVLGQLLVLAHGGNIRIGESCFIGEHSRIWSADSITIGDRVLISHNVNVHDHNAHSSSAHMRHEHFKEIFAHGHPAQLADVPSAPIVIEEDAWIGFNSTILKGVTIGRGAIVGAASVITKDVPPYAIVVGNPARLVGHAFP